MPLNKRNQTDSAILFAVTMIIGHHFYASGTYWVGMVQLRVAQAFYISLGEVQPGNYEDELKLFYHLRYVLYNKFELGQFSYLLWLSSNKG